MSEIKWEPKREWWHHGKNFLVVVKHHISQSESGRAPNRWNVYAYIYPKHWHFQEIKSESLYQDAAIAMPFHCGASYVRRHLSEDGVSAYQVGSDYDHLGDDRICESSPEDQCPSGEVFQDADRLIAWLSREAATIADAQEPQP
jgi:hypothetical protein